MSLDLTRSRLFYLLKPFGRSAGVGQPGRMGFGASGIMARLLIAAMMGGLLAWWWTAHRTIQREAGAVFGLEQLNLEVPLGQSVEIGRAALMHPRGNDFAEARHITVDHRALGRDGSGVFVRNIADQRRLSLRFGSESTQGGVITGSAERFFLVPGKTSAVTVGRAVLTFSEVGRTSFELTFVQGATTRKFRLALKGGGEELVALPLNPGDPIPAQPGVCRHPEGFDKIVGWVAGWLLPMFPRLGSDERRVLVLGGTFTCRDQRLWQVAAPHDVGWRQLGVAYRWEQQQFYLVPGEPVRRNQLVISFDGPLKAAGFSGVAWRLDAPDGVGHSAVTGFVAGRARYFVETTITTRGRDRTARVVITPRDRMPVFSETDCGWVRRGAERPADASDEDIVCPATLPPTPAGKLTREISAPFLLLDRFGGRDALQTLTRAERWWRVGMVLLALPLMAWLCRLGPAFVQMFRRASRVTTPGLGQALLAMTITATSCALALVPEIADGLGWRGFDGNWALAVMLANWFFAGCLLLLADAGILLGLFWIFIILIAGIGSLSMASMAVDGDSTGWAFYFVKHKLMFLDVLPPFVATLTVAPIRGIWPVMQELVVANRATASQSRLARLGYFGIRWSPVLLLIAAFLAWLLFGGQQGVGGIQPVEAGKFAAVVICGVMLLSMTRASRILAIRRGALRKFFSFLALFVFAGVLLFSPFLRNDYSPILILVMLAGLLVMLRVVPTAAGGLFQYIDDYVERRRVPMRFRPRVDHALIPGIRRPRVARGWAIFALVLTVTAGTVGGSLIALTSYGKALASLLNLDPPVWPETRDEQLKALQKALGHGRRVPVERIMTWVDLAYGAQTGEADAPPSFEDARFRDLGFQLIRSRVIVAYADCRASDELIPETGLVAEYLVRPVAVLLREVEEFFNPARGRNSLCAEFPAAKNLDKDEKAGSGGPSRRALLDPVAPIRIPVVQNDFAAAYLIGRHGVGAAALLMAGQSAILLMIAYAYLRLRQTTENEGAEGVVRHLLSVLVAGAGILFLLHWSISWSNVLGIFPVMGQPMTFLSAGTSHHQFMALPCVMIIILGLRYAGYTPKIPSRRSPPPPR